MKITNKVFLKPKKCEVLGDVEEEKKVEKKKDCVVAQ